MTDLKIMQNSKNAYNIMVKVENIIKLYIGYDYNSAKLYM